MPCFDLGGRHVIATSRPTGKVCQQKSLLTLVSNSLVDADRVVIRPQTPLTKDDAIRVVTEFVREYNEDRLHS
ncbi:MAG: hypothetical protein KDA87_07820, partial [Planctomycetales bacterium]|nr:hypothetical protein [Planctomycetales bacterium]